MLFQQWAMAQATPRLVRLARANRLVQGEGRLLRERAGVSLREMASILRVNPGDLSRWERGMRPRPDAALRWLKACDELKSVLIDAGGGG